MSDKMIELLREFESAERAFAVAEWLRTDTEQHARRADEAEIAIFAYVEDLEEKVGGLKELRRLNRQLANIHAETIAIYVEALAKARMKELTPELIDRLEIIHEARGDVYGKLTHDCAAWNNDPEDCNCKYRDVNMKILELQRKLEAHNG